MAIWIFLSSGGTNPLYRLRENKPSSLRVIWKCRDSEWRLDLLFFLTPSAHFSTVLNDSDSVGAGRLPSSQRQPVTWIRPNTQAFRTFVSDCHNHAGQHVRGAVQHVTTFRAISIARD